MTTREGGREGEEVQDQGEGGGREMKIMDLLCSTNYSQEPKIYFQHALNIISTVIISSLMEQLFIILSVFIVYTSNQ